MTNIGPDLILYLLKEWNRVSVSLMISYFFFCCFLEIQTIIACLVWAQSITHESHCLIGFKAYFTAIYLY